MSTDVVVPKKLMKFEESSGGRFLCSGIISKRRMADRHHHHHTTVIPFPSNQNSKFTGESSSGERMRGVVGRREKERLLQQNASTYCADLSIKSRETGYYTSSFATNAKVPLRNPLIFVVVSVMLMNFARGAESVPAPATVENLESKIKMFLESRCTMQNETLEHEEFKSFMACGPSHGAGIVKNLGRIPEYKSDDMDRWGNATKREIVTQCEAWPKDRTCQETTFRLIEKCFEMDQKFIFYFMFALTDVICQSEQSDLFIKFWQNGGDTCLGNHIKNLKKDWTDCFVKTSTVSNADVYRNFDGVMQCFRSQFDSDCFGEGSDEVLGEIMAEIRKAYLETSSSTILQPSLHVPIIVFLTAGWMTFLS